MHLFCCKGLFLIEIKKVINMKFDISILIHTSPVHAESYKIDYVHLKIQNKIIGIFFRIDKDKIQCIYNSNYNSF